MYIETLLLEIPGKNRDWTKDDELLIKDDLNIVANIHVNVTTLIIVKGQTKNSKVLQYMESLFPNIFWEQVYLKGSLFKNGTQIYILNPTTSFDIEVLDDRVWHNRILFTPTTSSSTEGMFELHLFFDGKSEEYVSNAPTLKFIQTDGQGYPYPFGKIESGSVTCNLESKDLYHQNIRRESRSGLMFMIHVIFGKQMFITKKPNSTTDAYIESQVNHLVDEEKETAGQVKECINYTFNFSKHQIDLQTLITKIEETKKLHKGELSPTERDVYYLLLPFLYKMKTQPIQQCRLLVYQVYKHLFHSQSHLPA